MVTKITVIGGGLAGAEAAWQLVRRGISVRLIEQRPVKSTPAHKTDKLAELVCSNSLRADDPNKNAIGLLHEEMRQAGSLILQAADKTRVPAGGALAVDRTLFSDFITQALLTHPLITFEQKEAPFPTDNTPTLIATGPLSSEKITMA